MPLLSKVKITFVSACLMLLSLSSGAVAGLAAVESRSEPSSWQGQEGGSEPAVALDLLKRVEFLQTEVQELRGKVEEQGYQLQQLQEQQKKLYMDLDRRLQAGAKPTNTSGVSLDEGEQVTHIPDTSASPAAASTATQQTLGAAPSQDELLVEEKAYQNAYHLIQNRDYEGALVAFQSFVKTFPRGKYLPNAQYWLGEIYLTKGELNLASEAFNTVYRNYGHHPKAADSLLKLGYVEYSKGQWKRSQELLEQVKNQFSGSTSAQLADARLQKMHHEGRI